MKSNLRVAIIGAGASGFFAAISVKENYPESEVTIFEKSSKPLAKVKISGGGRCNLTNTNLPVEEFIKGFPRGGRQLRKAFSLFGPEETMEWFRSRGVPLVVQPDKCVFPESQESQSIIDCLIRETKRLSITILTNHKVSDIIQVSKSKQLKLNFENRDTPEYYFDKAIVTTGGSPRKQGLLWLEKLGHSIESPVPSLFTFNLPNNPLKELMGVVAVDTAVSISGTKFKATGALLITHWGMSGPAILKLSSVAARDLNNKNYNFTVAVNWTGETSHEAVAEQLRQLLSTNPHKQLSSLRPFGISLRLWHFIITRSGLDPTKKCIETGKKGINKLVNSLAGDSYNVGGKSTFREEFVTCGGVSLSSVNINTFGSKKIQNLYFAGELLDIDGITGGYNLQAAWTTGFIAGKLQ